MRETAPTLRLGAPFLGVLLCFGMLSALFCGGCTESVDTPAVVVTCDWDGGGNMSVGGRLTDSSFDGVEYRVLSCDDMKIDGYGKVANWFLRRDDTPDNPMFRAVSCSWYENGQQVIRILGESQVEWVLCVPCTRNLRITDLAGGTIAADVPIPIGGFDIRIDEGKIDEETRVNVAEQLRVEEELRHCLTVLPFGDDPFTVNSNLEPTDDGDREAFRNY